MATHCELSFEAKKSHRGIAVAHGFEGVQELGYAAGIAFIRGTVEWK